MSNAGTKATVRTKRLTRRDCHRLNCKTKKVVNGKTVNEAFPEFRTTESVVRYTFPNADEIQLVVTTDW